MTYTVGEIAKILNIAPSTLRYYDKEGLLPLVERSDNGARMFHESDFNWLFMIECLKKSGLSIKDIKRYVDMTLKGDETIDDRLNLFREQREKVIKQMSELQEILKTLDYKCRFYEAAKLSGSISAVRNMTDDEIPENLREIRLKLNNTYQR